MSWSLELRSGDLTIGGARLGQTTGRQKLAQDLRLWLLERMGTDDLHPWYGSIVDGGTVNGQEQASLIATADWGRMATIVEAEIRRIVDQYQKQQIARSESDRMRYGKSTLSPDELLMSISGLQFLQAQDNLIVRIGLQTAAGSGLTINLPLGSQPTLT